MTQPRALFTVAAALPLLVLLSGCPNNNNSGTGLVPDATAAPVVVDAAPAAVDVNQCAACQTLAAQAGWTFEGIFADSACTDPLAQTVAAPCSAIAALGPTSLQYVDDVGSRKVGEIANVTLVDQVAAATPRYRKRGKDCVRANEGATDIAPSGCAGQKVCRDQAGALACTGCRTLSNGCPDFEETRVYATINDPAAKGAKAAGGGGGNLDRLRQCCAAIAAEAKRLGSSPEAGLINQAAAQCNAIVAAAGPSGNAPELGALRAIMAGRPVPAICSGF